MKHFKSCTQSFFSRSNNFSIRYLAPIFNASSKRTFDPVDAIQTVIFSIFVKVFLLIEKNPEKKL